MKTSVALCTFNGQKFLSQQLDSIINQTVPVDEIIICDDNSTDTTISIIKDYKEKYPYIKLFNNSNSLGTIKNFEKAISLCSGKYIFLSDQDDIWKKDKVEKTLSFFKIHPKCLLFFTDGELIDENNNSLQSTLFTGWGFTPNMKEKWKNNKEAIKDLMNNNNRATGATICIRDKLVNIALPIQVPKGMWHDTWLSMHAAKNNGLFFSEDTFIYYRMHNAQQVGIKEDQSICEKGNVTLSEYNKYLKNNFKEYYKYYIWSKRGIVRRAIKKLSRYVFSSR